MTETITIKSIVEAGLCIGCGLCETLTNGVSMQANANGSLRPFPINGFTTKEEDLCSRMCPGIHVRPALNTTPTDAIKSDTVWGQYLQMHYAWATDNNTRFIGSTGGVLTALGQYLIASQQAKFIYHVKADSDYPLHSNPCISENEEQVLAAAGSRYAPVAPLSALGTALNREQPFAIIAKPCDLNAIENLAQQDERFNRLITFRLTMVCGGQSTMTKAQHVLNHFDIDESRVTLYRHRGYGNPGPTRIETRDNQSVEISYQELWADEAGWCLESRCKLCPDALGECADIAAADVWPGGSPSGEDEGFNGIVVRTPRGETLVSEAVQAGYLTQGKQISVDEFNDFQPHQVSKKISLKWRYLGLARAGLPSIAAPLYRVDELGEMLPEAQREPETLGTVQRFTKADEC